MDSAIHCTYPILQGENRFEDVQQDDIIDLGMHLGGAILFSQRIYRAFIQQGYGNLIHLSSIQGVSAPSLTIIKHTYSPIEYSAIKASVISLVSVQSIQQIKILE